jgi:transcriptional regulator with XRE-family HTH domain
LTELGEGLRSVRERQHISLLEAAERTRIKAPYLEALEAGEYSALPGAAYITGFLRNYATYLGLHPDDVLQEYHARQPDARLPVRAATRVLENGRHREFRAKLFWVVASVFLLLCAGFAIKAYPNVYGKTTPPLNLTPANLGGIPNLRVHQVQQLTAFHLRLRAVAHVWARVTVDGHVAFDGMISARTQTVRWSAYHSIVVVTYDGASLKVFFNGRHLGTMAKRPGLIVEMANARGLRQIA